MPSRSHKAFIAVSGGRKFRKAFSALNDQIDTQLNRGASEFVLDVRLADFGMNFARNPGVSVSIISDLVREERGDLSVIRVDHDGHAPVARIAVRTIGSSTDSPVSSNAGNSIADELTKLADLKDRGLITDAEFDQQKSRLLS